MTTTGQERLTAAQPPPLSTDGMHAGAFTTPHRFSLLAVVALLAVGYGLAQRQRRRRSLRFAYLDLLDRVAPRRRTALRPDHVLIPSDPTREPARTP